MHGKGDSWSSGRSVGGEARCYVEEKWSEAERNGAKHTWARPEHGAGIATTKECNTRDMRRPATAVIGDRIKG